MDDFTNGGDNLRDASFSYLRSEQSSTPKSTSNRKIKTDHQDHSELGVFGAERYFNMLTEGQEDAIAPTREKRNPPDHLGCSGDGGGGADDAAKSSSYRPGTPSACSEMSWNSRTALLLRASSNNNSILERNPSRSRKRRALINGRWSIFATLWCAGSCSDEKSVFVDPSNNEVSKKIGEDQAGKLSEQPNRSVLVQPKDDSREDFRYAARSSKRSEDHFAFPILSSSTTTSTEENKKSAVISTSDIHACHLQEPPRMSLEVFGSKPATKGAAAVDEVAINLERKLSVLTWDAIPTKPQKRVPPKAAAMAAVAAAGNGRPAAHHHDQDMDSDASSDLFEIENITVGSTATSRSIQLVSAVDVDDVSRCATPNNNNLHSGYEPSEASIEWSVVTASAVDIGSVVYDYDEKKISANRSSSSSRYKASKSGGGGGILGCKSQKSVRVAESTYRSSTSKEMVKSSNV